MSDKTMWVLIIEDELELSDLLKDALEKASFKVLVCEDMGRASKMALNQKFNCIVADQMVRGKTGESFVVKFRKNERHLNHKTPVLLMSGALNQELIKNLGAEISGALVKPFNIADFVSKVKSICGMV